MKILKWTEQKLRTKDVIPEKQLNGEYLIKINNFKNKKKSKKKNLVYERDKYAYETIRSFAKDIFACKITLDDAYKAQRHLLKKYLGFKKGKRPRNGEKRKLKRDSVDSIDKL